VIATASGSTARNGSEGRRRVFPAAMETMLAAHWKTSSRDATKLSIATTTITLFSSFAKRMRPVIPMVIMRASAFSRTASPRRVPGFLSEITRHAEQF